MANIVYNGDFQIPLLESGVDLQYDAMSPQEASDFIWTGTNNKYLNNDTGYFDYPTPAPTGVSSQYENFQFNSLLYQSINVSTKGKYALTLYHCRRPTKPAEGLDILLNEVLVATIPGDIPESWTSFRIELNISRTGNQILKFIQPIDTLNEIAITNVSLVALELLTDCGAICLPPLNFNQGKVFNIEDYDYQDKPVSLRSGDEHYLKNNVDINLNGNFYKSNVSKSTK